jgi:hypothetical protein
MYRQIKRVKGKKYNNKNVIYDNIKFDSTKEGKRYLVLKQAEKDGIISNLELQVKFELIPSIKEEYVKHLKTKDKMLTRTLQLPITYICDFRYTKNGNIVIEDVKASPKMIPSDYKLKEKLFFWKFGTRIRRVFSETETI